MSVLVDRGRPAANLRGWSPSALSSRNRNGVKPLPMSSMQECLPCERTWHSGF